MKMSSLRNFQRDRRRIDERGKQNKSHIQTGGIFNDFNRFLFIFNSHVTIFLFLIFSCIDESTVNFITIYLSIHIIFTKNKIHSIAVCSSLILCLFSKSFYRFVICMKYVQNCFTSETSYQSSYIVIWLIQIASLFLSSDSFCFVLNK